MGERQQGDKIEIVLVTLYFSHHKLLLGAKRIIYLVNERKINKQTNSLSFFPPLDLTIFEKGMLKISYQDYRVYTSLFINKNFAIDVLALTRDACKLVRILTFDFPIC